jgi:malonyl CoA-acyl carrier protein transacylase
MMLISELRERARNGDAHFYLLFGGQGIGWFKELKDYYREPDIRPLIDLCLDAIREELPYVESCVALSHGLAVESWLADESTVPSREYLSCSGVSGPMIFVTQLASLRNLVVHGFDVEELLLHTRGMTGQSQGLFTASLLSLSRTGSAYDEAVRQFAKYVFYLGVRSQEIYPFLESTDEERERSAKVNDWRNTRPSPMVAVVNAPYDELEQRIRRFNSKVAQTENIHVSLRFSRSRVVLSSHRSSLIEFNAWNRSYFAENGIKYVYIPTTCPFHSALMEPIRPRVEADFARIHFGYAGNELKLPVYSFFDSRNLQDDEEIAIKLYLDGLINRLEWWRALEPIQSDDAITHVLDFGPGAENRHISRHVLETMGCSKPILSVRALCGAH